MVLDGGRPNPSGTSLQVLVVDCQVTIVELTRPVAFSTRFFLSIRTRSMPFQILRFCWRLCCAGFRAQRPIRVWHCTQPTEGRRVQCNSSSGGAAKQIAKRPTTSLSASLEALMDSLPAMNSQLKAIAERQRVMEASDPDKTATPKANPKKKGGKPSKGAHKGQPENDPDEA